MLPFRNANHFIRKLGESRQTKQNDLFCNPHYIQLVGKNWNVSAPGKHVIFILNVMVGKGC